MLTFSELQAINAAIDERSVLREASATKTGKTVFLSHSSKDAEFLPAIVRILESHGGRVYVDLGDERLPKTPSPETGRILRSTIAACRKLVLFLTPNSKDSKWAPWEVGVADKEKSSGNIALFPAAQHSWEEEWAGQEYLGLYDRIVWHNFANQEPEWLVLNHHANTAVKIATWLRS